MKVLLFILFNALSIVSIGQQYNWKNYNVSNGLAGNECYQVFQDRAHNIWVSSDAGVSKITSNGISNFGVKDGLPDLTVFGMCQDQVSGKLWCYTYSGRIAYFENNKWTCPDFNVQLASSISNGLIHSMASKNDTLYIGVGCTFGDQCASPLRITPSGKIEEVRSDTHAKLFSYNEGSIHVWGNRQDPLTVQFSSAIIKLLSESTTDSVNLTTAFDKGEKKAAQLYRVQRLKNNNLVISRNSHVMVVKQNGEILSVAKLPNSVMSIEEHLDAIWFGTATGIYSMNANYELNSIGIAGEYKVSGLLFDHEEGLWVSTLNRGLIYIPNLAIQTYKKTGFIKILGIAKFRDTLYYGTGNGHMFYRSGNNLNQINGVQLNHVFNLYANDSDLYALTINGPVLKSRNFVPTQANRSIYVKSISPSKQHGLVGLWTKGLYQINEETSMALCTKGLNFLKSRSTCEHNDTLFLLTRDEFAFYGDSTIHRVELPNTLEGAQFSTLFASQEGVYIATLNNGLYLFQNNSFRSILPTEFGIKDLLIHQNRLYLLSNKHVGIYDVANLDNIKLIDVLNQNSGLPHTELNTLFLENDTTLHIGTDNGACTIDLNGKTINSKAPKISILEILESGIPTKQTTLSHDQNNLQIILEGKTFRAVGEPKYRYKLHEQDPWIITDNATLNFNSLATGKYNFQAQSSNESGIWSDQDAIFNFEILPPYWKTMWFFLLCTGLLGVITWVILKKRFQVLREKDQAEKRMLELEKSALQAQMNPHFIFNIMNSIQSLILSDEPDEAAMLLSSFARLIRKVLDSSRKSFVTLEIELETITSYLKLERRRFKQKFDFDIQLTDEIEAYIHEVPPMILQPYLENAIKHAFNEMDDEGRIDIKIGLEGEYLKCTIIDNGIGRSKAAELQSKNPEGRTSVGLVITQERLAALNTSMGLEAKSEITDLISDAGVAIGTKVEVYLPYKQREV